MKFDPDAPPWVFTAYGLFCRRCGKAMNIQESAMVDGELRVRLDPCFCEPIKISIVLSKESLT